MKIEECQISNTDELLTKSVSKKIEHATVQSLRKIQLFLFVRSIKKLFGKKYLRGKKKENIVAGTPTHQIKQISNSTIIAGDMVKIRTREEILATLNERNKLEGCFFMQEMFQYCGKEFKVIKKVDNFFDEAAMEMRKARTTYLLEGLHCSGKLTGYITACDRNCYSFWKEAWMEKVPQ